VQHLSALHGQVLNVEALDSAGHRTCELCFMPEGRFPVGDVMLAQKLALELFEAKAIKVAHMSPPLHFPLQWRWLGVRVRLPAAMI
jgi:hypothetical protein